MNTPLTSTGVPTLNCQHSAADFLWTVNAVLWTSTHVLTLNCQYSVTECYRDVDPELSIKHRRLARRGVPTLHCH